MCDCAIERVRRGAIYPHPFLSPPLLPPPHQVTLSGAALRAAHKTPLQKVLKLPLVSFTAGIFVDYWPGPASTFALIVSRETIVIVPCQADSRAPSITTRWNLDTHTKKGGGDGREGKGVGLLLDIEVSSLFEWGDFDLVRRFFLLPPRHALDQLEL